MGYHSREVDTDFFYQKKNDILHENLTLKFWIKSWNYELEKKTEILNWLENWNLGSKGYSELF